MAGLAAEGKIDKNITILVVGPYYPTPGSDWNKGKEQGHRYLRLWIS